MQYVLLQPSLPMSRCCAKFIWQGVPPDAHTAATSACKERAIMNKLCRQLRHAVLYLQALDARPLVVG